MKRMLLGLVLSLWLVCLAVPALAAPSVDMSAQAVGGGRVRPGSWTTILVDLTNQGAEAAGELVVQPEEVGPWQSKPQYVVPLTLPAGAKKRVPFEIPLYMGSNMKVSFRVQGKAIQEQTVQLQILGPDVLYAGVLSDDELGIPALSRLGASRTNTLPPQVARLDAGTLPARSKLLESFNVLAISRFDSGKLSAEQLQALSGWVGRGGTLLLTGGPEWKRTLSALPPALVPVAITDVREVSGQALGEFAGKALEGKLTVSHGNVLRGQALVTADGTPVVVVDQVGAGRVIYLAFDPGLNPAVSWQGQTDLLERVVGAGSQYPQWEKENTEAMMQSALQQVPGLGLPSALLMGSLLGGYMLLVGPISYWILKRKDRREWMWLSVPVLSVLFVGAVYGLGAGKQSAVISNLITVTELSAGTGTMTSYVGVYAPSRNQLDVTLDGGRMVRPMMTYGRSDMDQGGSTRIVAGDRTRIELRGLRSYAMNGFALEQDIPVAGGLELIDVKVLTTGELSGRVVNRLAQPVKGLIVGYGTSWHRIGDLGPGDSSEPFSLAMSRATFKGGPMGFEPAMNGPWVTDWREQNRLQQIMYAVFGHSGTNVAPGSVTMVGWTDEPPGKPSVPDLGQMHRGGNLVYTALPIKSDPANGHVPPGVVVAVRTAGAGGFGKSPYGYSMAQGTHDFALIVPALNAAKVARFQLHVDVMSSGGAFTLQVRNQKTNQWVVVEGTGAVVLNNWADLLGPGGMMELRFDVSQHLEIAAPTISTEGVSQ